MRTLLKLMVLAAALLVGGWILGETLLARGLRSAIAEDPRIEASDVTPLREAGRIGVRLHELLFFDPDLALQTGWLDLFVPPTAPNAVHLALAPGTRLSGDGGLLVLGPSGAEAEMHLSPIHGLAPSRARLVLVAPRINGLEAASSLRLEARLGRPDADAPPETGAAYAIDAMLMGLSLDAVTGHAATGNVSIAGRGQVWLDHLPMSVGRMFSGAPARDAPHLLGLRLDQVRVTLDGLALTLRGRLVADNEGRASGALLIDTADAAAIVARGADLGLLPDTAVPLVTTVLGNLAEPQTEGSDRDDSEASPSILMQAPADMPSGSAEPMMPDSLLSGWPKPAPGEQRLVIWFHAGKGYLGQMPIGPAPQMVQR